MTEPAAPVSLSKRAGCTLRILFVLRAANYDRMFECLIRGLLARGHTVRVVAEGAKRLLAPGFNQIFDALSSEEENFSWVQLDGRRGQDGWLPLASMLRRSIDCLRFLEPEFADAEGLSARARLRAPMALRFLMWTRVLRLPRVRHAVARALRALEAALPSSKLAGELLDQEQPDLVLLAPFIGLGESQADYLRVAQARGTPVVIPIPSWDNLTNKGVIRDTPELTIVWNATQVKEAIELHGLPPGRVLATGAHSFDHWFEWRPSRDRGAFLETVGLPDRPFLMYVCSSSFVGGREAEFVDDWIRRLRTDAPPELAQLGVMVRPHPQNVLMWYDRELDDPTAVVWPPKGAVPSDQQHKADYYDSLYHSAAVVGINTSALIEAAIVRRSVFTIRTEHHRHSQDGTVHFAYLTGKDGAGILTAADSWEEHFAQLRDEVAGDGDRNQRVERFLVDFLRPNGLDRPATPFAVGAIEQVFDQPRVEPPKPGVIARTTVNGLVLVARPLGALSRWIRRSRLGLWISARRARGHRDADRARKALERARGRRVKRRQRRLKAIKRARARTAKRMRRFTIRARAAVGLEPRWRMKPAKARKAVSPAKAQQTPKPTKDPKAAHASKAPKPTRTPKRDKPREVEQPAPVGDAARNGQPPHPVARTESEREDAPPGEGASEAPDREKQASGPGRDSES